MSRTGMARCPTYGHTTDLSLPKVFSDGCVLQTWDQGDARSFVYGLAPPSASVRVAVVSADNERPFRRFRATRSYVCVFTFNMFPHVLSETPFTSCEIYDYV